MQLTYWSISTFGIWLIFLKELATKKSILLDFLSHQMLEVLWLKIHSCHGKSDAFSCASTKDAISLNYPWSLSQWLDQVKFLCSFPFHLVSSSESCYTSSTLLQLDERMLESCNRFTSLKLPLLDICTFYCSNRSNTLWLKCCIAAWIRGKGHGLISIFGVGKPCWELSEVVVSFYSYNKNWINFHFWCR